jgi:hypothetical protein
LVTHQDATVTSLQRSIEISVRHISTAGISVKSSTLLIAKR